MKRITGILLFIILTAAPVHAGDLDDHIAVEAMRLVWNIEEGTLTEDASAELLTDAIEKIRLTDNRLIKRDLYIMAYAAERELEKPNSSFYGTCTITHYCNCSACCGKWAGGGTASGTIPTAGRTVANGALPFGTRVKIGDTIYTVEDRGVSGDVFDIYCDSHSEALNRGMYQTEVYIVE